ncbi:MAG: T9SS type A sorting domain-containing protein [Hymenobacter sp.]|nr:MAG: T9SS type A sorting domain-containing protein [Hymenobacter sp.]
MLLSALFSYRLRLLLFMQKLYTLPLVLAAAISSVTAQAQAIVNSGSVIALTGGATVFTSGSVLNNSGTLDLSAGSNSLLVGGNLVNANGALLVPGPASTVTLTGAARQQLDLRGASLANLTINNTSGGVQLPAGSNATVTGALTLTSGLVTTDPASTLTLADGATMTGQQGSAPLRYVVGNLAAVKASVSGATTFPNDFSINPTTALTNLTVTRTAGLRTAQVSYGTNGSGASKGIDQIWQTSAPLTNATVTATWLMDNDNDRPSFASSQLWARGQAPAAGSDWAAVGSEQNATDSRTVTGLVPAGSSYSFFTVSTADAPLPVTLVAFSAQRAGTDGLLSWTTASEVNNAYFQVESSWDGVAFQFLGRVAGTGTSSQAHSYQYRDIDLARYGAPLVYYRLRQVDVGGPATYSPVRTVSAPVPAGWLVQAYPNPSTSPAPVSVLVSTEVSAEVHLALTDAMGRLVGQQTAMLPAGATTLPLTAATGLATGVYVLQVRQGARQQTIKLVRQ